MVQSKLQIVFIKTVCLLSVLSVPTTNAQHLPLEVYNDTEGFPNVSVTAINQDDKGYLWIGTQAGLSRFDGFRFITHTSADGLAGNIVVEIQDDGSGGYWIGTDQGLSHFDGDSIRSYRFEDRVTENTLWGIYAEQDGTAWMATNGAGLMMRSPDGEFQLYRTTGDELTNTFYCVTQTADGTILAGGRNGLFAVSGDSLKSLHEDELPPSTLNVILQDSQGTIWLGYQRNGIYRINGGDVEKLSELPLLSGRTIMEDDRGTIWIGGDGGGLVAFYPNGQYKHYTTEDGLLANEIGSLFQDKDGSIWIGQLYHGLERIKNRGILNYNFGGGDISFVNGIFEDDGDNIWVSTFNGLHQLSGGEIMHHSPGIRFWQATQSDDGTLWHTAIENKIISFRDGSFTMMGEMIDPDDSVFLSAYATEDGRLLFGSNWNGLYEYSDGQFMPIPQNATIKPRAISGMIESDRGLWISSHFDGVFLLKNGELIDKELLEQTGSHQLNHIYCDGDTIWAATEQSFFYLDDGSWIDGAEEMGITADNFSFILKDSYGHFWLGNSNVGILHHDGENLYTINTADGLSGFGLNHGAVLLDRQNRLWVGTNSGVSRLDLNRLDLRKRSPHIEFQRVQLYDKDVMMEPGKQFRHNENYLKFDFSGIYLRDPAGISYRYKMEQIDQDWQYSDLGTVQYTSIPPGEYRFEVEALYGNYNRSEQAAVIDFVILPPFWQTWWFLLICLIAITGILYGIHSYRVSQLLKMERIRMQIAGDLHDEVGGNLSSISLLAEMVKKSKKLEPDEQRRIETVQKASLKTMDAMSDIVWAINPDNDSIEDMILRMKEVANVLLVHPEHAFDADPALENEKIDLLFKRDFFLIYKESLNNIVKHSNATKVEINVCKDVNYIKLRIQDNGCGFKPEIGGNGMGLKSMKQRAERLKGDLIVESSKGNGCKIILKAKLT